MWINITPLYTAENQSERIVQVLEDVSDSKTPPKLPMDRNALEMRLHVMAQEIQGNGLCLQGSLASC